MWALSVTSNGLKVDKNFELTEKAYVTWEKTGVMPSDIGIGNAATRYDSITLATGATAKFCWSITNNDNINAADVYASITHAI